MVPHVDIGEHDVDILVTDQGLADLRGRDEVERAELIITRCAHPAYQDMLRGYLKRALAAVGGHHPQLPDEAFAWYRRLKETGTMCL
jgi:acyl-CoA hydrolase